MVVVFTLEKFRCYIVGSLVTIFIDHAALKYLLSKQDTKSRLTRWILLCQEFNLTIKDKKRVEKVVANHLSRLVSKTNSEGLPMISNSEGPMKSKPQQSKIAVIKIGVRGIMFLFVIPPYCWHRA